MKINVQGVLISFDETVQDLVRVSYTGKADKVREVKEILSRAGGKYGNRFDPEYCIASDLVVALSVKFNVKFDPDIDFYDPPIPEGAIP